MFITPGLEGLLEDEVAIGVIGNHHILVAGPGLDGEMSGVVCVELADGDNMDVDFVGWELRFFGGNCWKKRGGVESRGQGLVERTFWHCCARWPRMVSSASGQ